MLLFLMLFILPLLLVFIFVYRRCSRAVPILMYHRISDIPGKHTIPPAVFRQQLDLIAQSGHHTISLAEYYQHLAAGTALPEKPVILTFDDAYEDAYSTVLPELKQRGMKAAVFVIAQFVASYNDWEDYEGKPHVRTMNWDQLREWHASGMEIGSHTETHPYLSRIPEEEMQKELRESKTVLETNLGIPIDFLCYPYGDFNASVIEYAQTLGYKAALAIAKGTSPLSNPPFALRRVTISERHQGRKFLHKISPWHVLDISFKQLEFKMHGR